MPEPTRPPLKRKDSDEATVSALATKARVSRESVQDMYDDTETARLAEVVLPAAG